MRRYETDPEAAAARRRWQDTIEAASRQTPESFQAEAYETAALVDSLDTDPIAALDTPGARTFVNRLTRFGFVTAYFRGIRSRDPRYVANSRASLPRWLQPEFLVAQRLQADRPPVQNPQAVEHSFQRFLTRQHIPLQVRSPMGDYYGPDVLTGRRAAGPLNFKMYVEGRALEAALQTGAIDQAYERLRRDGAALRHLKLHHRNRLVFYFRSSILTAGPYAESVFSHYHVPYRGPAQDVERVVHAAAGLELQAVESNDQALEDNSAHWDMYNPHPYAPQPFLGHYLEQCRLWGKSPADPYRTSFLTMYVDPSDPRLGESNYLDQARHLAAPYDLVLRPIPPLPPLTAPRP